MRFPSVKVIIPVVLLIAAVAFAAVAGTGLMRKSKADFQGELAKRLESEESLLKAQSELAAMTAQIEPLRAQLAEKKAEAASLSAELEREKELRAATDEALRRVQKQFAALKAAGETALEDTVSTP